MTHGDSAKASVEIIPLFGRPTLRALATPGHTHEHIVFELLDSSSTLGVFTGGSLIVDSAARTDLISPERTEELVRTWPLRASDGAASLLARAGCTDISVLDGGPQDWANTTGSP